MAATEPRLETGPYRHHPDDWQGVFIRGDNAAYFALQLRELQTVLQTENVKLPFLLMHVIQRLQELLESAVER